MPPSNREKSDSIDYATLAATLSKARRLKPKVESKIKEFNEETDFITATTKVALLANTEEKRQEAADIIFDEELEFEPTDIESGDYYIKSIRRIKLYAKIPTIKQITPDCMFMFRPLKLRECHVVVSHNEIFSNLFIANGEYEELSERLFIESIGDGSFWINLGGCSFCLDESETQELCHIIDAYKEFYFNKVQELEIINDLDGMTVTSNGEIKLCELTKNFCRSIFSFIREKKKDKRWDIFEPCQTMIKVYTDANNEQYSEGYHAIIRVQEEDNTFWFEDRKVGLYLQNYYMERSFKISRRDWWSPKQVKLWLEKELFPACMEADRKGKKYSSVYNVDFLEQQHRLIEIESRDDVDELCEHIKTLQEFYATRLQRKLRFKEGSGKFYSSFLILFQNCVQDVYIPFLAEKLDVTLSSAEDIQDYIHKKKSENSKKLTYSEIELLLRCFIECLDKGKANLSQKQFIDVWAGIEELVLEYNQEMIRERYL